MPKPEKDLKIALLLDYYGGALTGKQREVVDLYYNEDLSLAEISEHAGITRQGVRDSIKRGEAQLLDMEDSLGLVRKIEQLEEFVMQMENIGRRISNFAKENAYVKPIEDFALEIDAAISKVRL